jgi:hypothetical protein
MPPAVVLYLINDLSQTTTRRLLGVLEEPSEILRLGRKDIKKEEDYISRKQHIQFRIEKRGESLSLFVALVYQ